jgi:hypothetical protein
MAEQEMLYDCTLDYRLAGSRDLEIAKRPARFRRALLIIEKSGLIFGSHRSGGTFPWRAKAADQFDESPVLNVDVK